MEKEREFKIIAVIALVVAVAGIGVGFAAYTRSFTVSTFDATVNASDINPFTPTTGSETSTGLVLSDAATTTTSTVTSAGTASNNTWSGIVVAFDDQHRTASLTATVNNFSAYAAYLKSITIADGFACAAETPAETNGSLVTSLCSSVAMTVSIDTASATYDADASTTISNYTAASNATAGTVSAASGSTPGTKTVTLSLSIGNNVVIPDGDVIITVPTITFGYSSLEN